MVVRTDEQPEFALTLQPQGAYPHNERPLQSEPGNAEEGGRARRVAPREDNLPQPLVTNFTGEQFAERLTMGKCYLGTERRQSNSMSRDTRARR